MPFVKVWIHFVCQQKNREPLLTVLALSCKLEPVWMNLSVLPYNQTIL